MAHKNADGLAENKSASGIKITVAFVCLIAAVYAIQLTQAGIILEFFGAPLWGAALLYLMIIVITALSVDRKISRWWLALPVIFVISGIAMGIVSQYLARSMYAETDAQNAASAKILTGPLVFKYSGWIPAPQFMSDFRLDGVYGDNIRETDGEHSVLYRVGAPAECAKLKLRGRRPTASGISNYEGQFKDIGSEKNCLVTQIDADIPATYSIKSTIKNVKNFWNDGTRTEYVVYDANNKPLSRASSVQINAFFYFPILVSGCVLNDVESKMVCQFGLAHLDHISPPNRDLQPEGLWTKYFGLKLRQFSGFQPTCYEC